MSSYIIETVKGFCVMGEDFSQTIFKPPGRAYRLWSSFIAMASIAGFVSCFPLFYVYAEETVFFFLRMAEFDFARIASEELWKSLVLILAFAGLWFLFHALTIWVGVSVWLHRILTHAARKTHYGMKIFLGIVAAMAGEGHSRDWAARHRSHHAKSDEEGDPHSPVYSFAKRIEIKAGVRYVFPNWRAKVKGFWHAQHGWIFTEDTDPIDYKKWIPDLLTDPAVQFVDRFYFGWVILGLILPAFLGGLITYGLYEMFWYGFLLGLVSAGFGRLGAGFESTFSVNSYGHLYGVQRFNTGDNSRNPVTRFGRFLMFLSGGEIPQNTHHRFPRSARIGLTRAETRLDMGWHIIRFFDWCGLTRGKNEPTEEEIKKYEIVPVVA